MIGFIVPVQQELFVGIIVTCNDPINFKVYLNTSPKSFHEVEIQFQEQKNVNMEKEIPKYIQEIANKLSLIKQGMDQDTSNIILDYSEYTEKQVQVIKTAMKIPVNEIWPYSKVAEEAGLPRAQRFVGTTMRVLRQPYIVPVQRVKSISFLKKKQRKAKRNFKKMPL